MDYYGLLHGHSPWDTFGVLLDYLEYSWSAIGLFVWTTYNNSLVLSCIEFILGMEVRRGKGDKPLASLAW